MAGIIIRYGRVAHYVNGKEIIHISVGNAHWVQIVGVIVMDVIREYLLDIAVQINIRVAMTKTSGALRYRNFYDS